MTLNGTFPVSVNRVSYVVSSPYVAFGQSLKRLEGVKSAPQDQEQREINDLLNSVVAVHPGNKHCKLTGRDLLRRLAIKRGIGDLCYWRDRTLLFAQTPNDQCYMRIHESDVVEEFSSYGAKREGLEKAQQVTQRMIELGLIARESIQVWGEMPAELFYPASWGRTKTYELNTLKITPKGLSILSQSSPWLAWMLGHRTKT